MKIETQPLEDHQIKITIEVPQDTIDAAMHRAARKISSSTRIPGFRPGKAPYQVVLRQFGDKAVFEEAVEFIIDDVYPKMIEESGIRPYGSGALEDLPSKDPLTLVFRVPLEPVVELGDYRSIHQEYSPEPVTDAEVEKAIKNLREQMAILEPVDRPIQYGDMVTITLSGNRVNPEEGQNPTLIPERSMPFFVQSAEQRAAFVAESEDSSPRDEWPFEGLSDALVGMSKEETKTIFHTYSETSTYESLRGTEAEFVIKVDEIKSRTIPEFNDDFAISVSEYSSADELRSVIQKDLEEQHAAAYNESYDDEVLEKVVALSTIKYPPDLLEDELERMMQNLQNRLQERQMELDLYLKIRKMDKDALLEEMKPQAEKRIKHTLILLELAKQEKIEISPEELKEEVEQTVNLLGKTLSEKEARQLSDQRVYGRLVGNIMEDMLLQNANNRLRSIVSGKADTLEAASSEEVPVEAAVVVEETISSPDSSGAEETTEA